MCCYFSCLEGNIEDKGLILHAFTFYGFHVKSSNYFCNTEQYSNHFYIIITAGSSYSIAVNQRK